MEKVKFFTHYDRPEQDCEYYEEGTSLTVPDQVEPVSVTVARCMRGEVLSLSSQKDTYYEVDEDTSPDEAFAKFDETTAPGFDLADVPSLVRGASQDANDVGEADVAKPTEVVALASTSTTDTSSKTESPDDSNVK